MGRPVLFLFLVAASLTDLKARYIDNLHIIFGFILGLASALLERGVRGAADGMLTALAVFLLLYAFYAGGYLGAGDIKFIMAAAVYTGHEVMERSLIPITIFSIVLLMYYAVKSGRLRDARIPMALPVSMGIILSLR
ncbi:MAG: prepilin peptidase [Lachnospiraceae bacterium]|nr:prepilin peptidase [Lachnospiraceae bacterium]